MTNEIPGTHSDSSVIAVVVMYNSSDEAGECAASCLAQIGVRLSVIVVDNGSTDASGDAIRSRFATEPRLSVLPVSPNSGFSGGANAGLRKALERGSDYIWLLTDDIEIDANAGYELARAMDEDPRAGLAGQYIYDQTARNQIYFGGGIVTFNGASHEHEREFDDGSLSIEPARETGFVTGASMFFRSDALRRTGLMDESYWLYWEDVDISLRVKEAGYQLIVVPRSKAWHNVTPSRHKSMPTRLRYYWRNYLKTVEKHGLGDVEVAQRQALGLLRDEYHREGLGASWAILMGIWDFRRRRSGPIRGAW